MATYTTPDNGTSGMKDGAQNTIDEVKERLSDAKDRVVERADSLATQLADKIKARPLAAVGIAFGIGYVAMRIFRK